MDWLHGNIGLVGGAAVGIAVIWLGVKFLLPRKKVIAEQYKLNVLCRKCKWQGIVTKYNQVCPKCAGRELDVL